MKAGVLALLACTASVTHAEPVKTLLALDCDSQAHFMPGVLLGVTVDARAYMYMGDSLIARVKDRALCACPDATAEQLNARFNPFDAFVASLSNTPVPESTCLDQFAKTVPKVLRDVHGRSLNTIEGADETCDWAGRGSCHFQLPVTELRQSLQVAMKRCPNGNPSFSVSCSGEGCDMLKVCSADADCPTAQKCTDMIALVKEKVMTTVSWKDLVYETGKRWYLFATSAEEEKCGGVEDLVTKVFHQLLGGSGKASMCVPDVQQVMQAAATLSQTRVTLEPHMKTVKCLEKMDPQHAGSYTNVKVEPWSGVLGNGEVSSFNLLTGRYGEMPKMPLQGDESIGLMCDTSVLTEGFGLRVKDLNLVLDTVMKAHKEEWVCRGHDPKVYERIVELYNPELLLSLTKSFHEKFFGNDADTPNFLRDHFHLTEQMFAGVHGMAARVLPQTFDWDRWEREKKASLTVDLTVIGLDLKVDLWLEGCPRYADGLPQIVVKASGLLVDAIAGKAFCKTDADCAGKGLGKAVCSDKSLIASLMDLAAPGADTVAVEALEDFVGSMLFAGNDYEELWCAYNPDVDDPTLTSNDPALVAMRKKCTGPQFAEEDMFHVSFYGKSALVQGTHACFEPLPHLSPEQMPSLATKIIVCDSGEMGGETCQCTTCDTHTHSARTPSWTL